ncbi:hypothetical protein [Pseudoduganella flava]|uniref:hypothetical protein n=1 Tax=Pseudoduganella flava TaxID=871742 RepID=UPI0011A88973|nr:hypothetical protein [Pseudoduganella flava]
MSVTFEILKEKYGAVLTLEQLAETLSRKPEGVRMALSRKEPWAKDINAAKVYIGRRVYFPVESVARLLDGTFANNSRNKSHE